MNRGKMVKSISDDVLKRIVSARNTMLGTREITTERNRLMVESYKQTEGKPACLRRAESLKHILQNMTLFIGDHELIVGRLTDKPRGCCFPIEFRTVGDQPIHLEEELPIPDDVQKELDPLLEYWREHPINGGKKTKVPSEFDEMYGTFYAEGPGMGHHSIEYRFILENGTVGLKQKIDERIGELSEEDRDIIDQLTASRICLEGLEILADRYAELADSMAQNESDDLRRQELKDIAANCRKVPREPAESFYQALQCIWFTKVGLLNEDFEVGIGFMRPDQYLYPYYENDISKGTITCEDAFLLISLWLVKCNEELPTDTNRVMSINMTLGGVDEEGNDGINDLSWMILEAEEVVALSNEDIIIRVNDKMPDEFLERACVAARNLNGKLKFVGDNIIIRQLMKDGKPLEMARNYCITGCNSATVPGKSYDMPGGLVNLPFLLDLALHDGYSTVLGKQVGAHTGDAKQFTSYYELWEAFRIQCCEIMPYIREVDNIMRSEWAEYRPNPLQSVLCYGYIEKGIDVIKGGLAPNIELGMSLSGAPNVGDSLAVVKKLVFEEKRLSMSELIEALDRDFEGDEGLLNLIDSVPKFGNNKPYVDRIVNEVLTMGSEILEDIPCLWDAHPVCAAGVISCNVLMGKCVGALPDGRKKGLPISEGGISPYQGRNTNGATATLLSVARLDHMKLRHGSVLNLRFDPAALNNDAKIEKFAKMIRTYFNEGGFLVQFNIVTTETLIEAQKHPEKYRDLMVRVATFASYFVELEKDLQDDIINRTMMEQ